MQPVQVERADGVVTVTLNRPEKRNALSLGMFRELREALEEVAANPEDRVLVLTGAGGNFSSGADLTPDGESPPEAGQPLLSRVLTLMREDIARTVLALHRLPKPALAAVSGVAAGAGANLALGCDLVFAAEDARFSQIFVRRALSVDAGGSWLLPRLVGLRKAKELAFLGDWIGAAEASRIGLVSRTFPASELPARVHEWAARLARQAPLAVSIIKRSLDRSFELSLAEALEEEAVAQALCITSSDFAEGMQAFLQKREPRFTGG